MSSLPPRVDPVKVCSPRCARYEKTYVFAHRATTEKTKSQRGIGNLGKPEASQELFNDNNTQLKH
jgi:hypothetical protein